MIPWNAPAVKGGAQKSCRLPQPTLSSSNTEMIFSISAKHSGP